MYCCFQAKVIGVWTEPNITQFQTFFFPWTCFATYFLFQLHLQYVICGLKKRLLEFGPTEPKSKFLSLHGLNYFVKMRVASYLLWVSTNVVQGKVIKCIQGRFLYYISTTCLV
jgi:hypothetical protein